MQIRCETTKKRCTLRVMEVLLNGFHVQIHHQKGIGDRSVDTIVQIHRRHVGEIIQKTQKYRRRQGFGEKLRKVLMHVNLKIDSRLRQQCSKRTCQIKRQGGSWVIHIPSRKHNLMQVRPAGQAGYPISLVASLDTVPVKCCVPLQM